MLFMFKVFLVSSCLFLGIFRFFRVTIFLFKNEKNTINQSIGPNQFIFKLILYVCLKCRYGRGHLYRQNSLIKEGVALKKAV